MAQLGCEVEPAELEQVGPVHMAQLGCEVEPAELEQIGPVHMAQLVRLEHAFEQVQPVHQDEKILVTQLVRLELSAEFFDSIELENQYYLVYLFQVF
jgi:hypothetical protein